MLLCFRNKRTHQEASTAPRGWKPDFFTPEFAIPPEVKCFTYSVQKTPTSKPHPAPQAHLLYCPPLGGSHSKCTKQIQKQALPNLPFETHCFGAPGHRALSARTKRAQLYCCAQERAGSRRPHPTDSKTRTRGCAGCQRSPLKVTESMRAATRHLTSTRVDGGARSASGEGDGGSGPLPRTDRPAAAPPATRRGPAAPHRATSPRGGRGLSDRRRPRPRPLRSPGSPGLAPRRGARRRAARRATAAPGARPPSSSSSRRFPLRRPT